jgi:hypothetical protein
MTSGAPRCSLLVIIHRSAWKGDSVNFVLTAFPWKFASEKWPPGRCADLSMLVRWHLRHWVGVEGGSSARKTTDVRSYLVVSVFVILGGVFLPFSWIRGYVRVVPNSIENTRWYRGTMRGVMIVLVLVLGYGIFFLGWSTN